MIGRTVDGLLFAFFLSGIEAKGSYNHLFKFLESIASNFSDNLGSERRAKYTNGLLRHYPELDD